MCLLGEYISIGNIIAPRPLQVGMDPECLGILEPGIEHGQFSPTLNGAELEVRLRE